MSSAASPALGELKHDQPKGPGPTARARPGSWLSACAGLPALPDAPRAGAGSLPRPAAQLEPPDPPPGTGSSLRRTDRGPAGSPDVRSCPHIHPGRRAYLASWSSTTVTSSSRARALIVATAALARRRAGPSGRTALRVLATGAACPRQAGRSPMASKTHTARRDRCRRPAPREAARLRTVCDGGGPAERPPYLRAHRPLIAARQRRAPPTPASGGGVPRRLSARASSGSRTRGPQPAGPPIA